MHVRQTQFRGLYPRLRIKTEKRPEEIGETGGLNEMQPPGAVGCLQACVS